MQTGIQYWALANLCLLLTLNSGKCLRYSDVQECETSLLLDLYFNWDCARFKYPEILLVMEYQTDHLHAVFSYVKEKRRDNDLSKEQRTITPIDYNMGTVPPNDFLETRPYIRATTYRLPELIRFTPPSMDIQSLAAHTSENQDYDDTSLNIIWRITANGPKIKNDVIDILKSTDRADVTEGPNYRKQYARPATKTSAKHKKITSMKKTTKTSTLKSTTKLRELFENFLSPDSDKDEDIDDSERRHDEDIPVLRHTTLPKGYDDTDEELFSKRSDYDEDRLIQDNSGDSNAKRYKGRKLEGSTVASRRVYGTFEGASNAEDFEEFLARNHFISTLAPRKDEYSDYEDGVEIEHDNNIPKKTRFGDYLQDMSTKISYQEVIEESSTIGIHGIQDFDLEKYKVKPHYEEKVSVADDWTDRRNKYYKTRNKRCLNTTILPACKSDCTSLVCNVREKRFLPYYGGLAKNREQSKNHHLNQTDSHLKHIDKNYKYSDNAPDRDEKKSNDAYAKSHEKYLKKHVDGNIKGDSDDEFKFGLEGKDDDVKYESDSANKSYNLGLSGAGMSMDSDDFNELVKRTKLDKYSLLNRLIPKVSDVLNNDTKPEEVIENELLEEELIEQQKVLTTQSANDSRVEMSSKQLNFSHVDIKGYPFLAIYVYEPEKVYCDSIYVSKRWLVTSARCLVKHWGFSGRPISNVFTHKIVGQVRAYVVVCNDKWWLATKMFYVHQSIVHEDFMAKGSYNDVGLIKLEEDMENCGMSSLDLKKKWPEKGLTDDPNNIISALSVGWGLYRFWSFAENSYVYKMNGLNSYNVSLKMLRCPTQPTRLYEVIHPKHVHENLCVMVDDILVEEIVSLTRFDPEIGGVLVSGGIPVAIASGVSYTSNGERFLSFTPIHAYKKWLHDTMGRFGDEARNEPSKNASKYKVHDFRSPDSKLPRKPVLHGESHKPLGVQASPKTKRMTATSPEQPEQYLTEHPLEVLTASVQRSENRTSKIVLHYLTHIFCFILNFSITTNVLKYQV